MQYLLTIWMEEPAADFELTPEMMAPWAAFNDEGHAAGVLQGGSGLQHSTTATTVRGGGEVVLTDGPFVESKEYMAGFWILEAPDLDAALALAAEGSKVCRRPVEVRPFLSDPE